jgi:hypothetical protein
MKRILVIGVAAMATVFLALIGAVWWATRPPEAPAPALAQPATRQATPVPEPSSGAIDLGKAPLGGIPLPPPVIVKDEPPPPPPSGSWEAVPILASRRGPVRLALDEDVQPKLTECFRSNVASRGGTILQVKDAAPLQDTGVTTLLLQIEVSQDRAFIVAAPLESRGSASDGTIACAQGVLRGQTAPAGGLPSGRHRIRFLLTP